MSTLRPWRNCQRYADCHKTLPLLLSGAAHGRPPSTPTTINPYHLNRRNLGYLPAILSPSFWKSITPGFLRRRQEATPGRKKEWNPATFFIWMALLIGSQSIQMLSLRGEHDKFSRDTDAKLALLRGVVRRTRNGEDVDTAAVLGTGDPVKEKEWEQVMRELEAEDAVFRPARKRNKQREEVEATGDETSNEQQQPESKG